MTISATTQGIKPGVCTSTNRPSAPFDGQVIYMTDVDQTAVWDGSQWTVLAPIAGGRNKIINGAMDVWQRGTSFTTDAAATNIYTADRWSARALYPGFSATQTITRESTHVPTGFIYSLKSVVSTAIPQNNARMQIGYTMENADALKYAGKTMVVSFQAKAIGNINIVYAGANYNTSGGRVLDGTNIVQVTPTINTSSFTTCTFTFTVPSAATLTSSGTLGIYFVYSRSAGTEQVGDGIYLGAVQMEVGTVSTPFEIEDYATTFAKCQRYFETQDWSVNTWRNAVVYATGATPAGYFTYQPKRSLPSFSWSGNGSARYVYHNGNVSGSQTLTAQYTSYNGASFSASTAVAFSSGWVDNAGTLSISSEL